MIGEKFKLKSSLISDYYVIISIFYDK